MKKTDSQFESTLAFTSVMSIIGGLSISSKVMTSAATANSMKLTAYLGILILLFGILVGFWYIKRKKKQTKVKVRKNSRKKENS